MAKQKTTPAGKQGMSAGDKGKTMDGVTELDAAAAGTRERGLDPRMRLHIGRRIKALYDEVAEEPVPDRFVDLLEELARKERESR